MKLIVGLGNPGKEYAMTRHNAGFMVVDHLAIRHSLTGSSGGVKSRFQSAVIQGDIAGCRCLLIEPMTYMNRSGQAVRGAVDFYKSDPESDLLVVVDDVCLPTGRLRLRPGGGAGGHKGLADIQRVLGTDRYTRMRVGVDSPRRGPLEDYVLSRFTKDQQQRIDEVMDTACDAIECWLRLGVNPTMDRFNRLPPEGGS